MLSQFRRPDYLGAWNRLKLPRLNPRLPLAQDLTSQDRHENDSGPRFKDFLKYKKQISPKSKALDCNVLFKTLISSYEKESGINKQSGEGVLILRVDCIRFCYATASTSSGVV